MKLKKLLFLIVTTAVVIIAASLFWQERAPQQKKEKEKLFPELAEQINQVRIVEIKGYEEDVILSHQNGVWAVQSSDSFPAIADKVRSTIINLSELEIDSGKTSKPELYARLGVEGPYDRQSKSKLLNLMDENGNLLSSLIVGKARESVDAIPAFYGRLPDAEQALLLLGTLDISSQDKDWFQRQVIDLASDEVKSVRLTQPDGEISTLFRESEGQVNFSLKELPEGKKQQSEVILNSMGTLLEDVRAEGVSALQSFEFPEQANEVEIKTFRGLIIRIRLTSRNDRYFANFQFAFDSPETDTEETEDTDAPTPEEEVAMLNQLISGWVFQLQKFKYDDMTKRMSAFIRN